MIDQSLRLAWWAARQPIKVTGALGLRPPVALPRLVAGEPWGHKVTLSIYVQGERPHPIMVTRAAQDAAAMLGDRVVFGGASVDEVRDLPLDAGGT